MKNLIDASIEFSFKGEDFSPVATIDLDEMMNAFDSLPDFYMALAKHNNIDAYSYLYEVMQVHEIFFENATGLASQCVDDGHFDQEKFQQLWHQQQEFNLMQNIAKRFMDVEDLGQQEQLKNALLEAFRLGKSACK